MAGSFRPAEVVLGSSALNGSMYRTFRLRHDPAVGDTTPACRAVNVSVDGMEIEWTDFNRADDVIATEKAQEWKEIESALRGLLLHLKASDQKGIQGRAIFDPKGTNEAIKQALKIHDWTRIPIPAEFTFLGTDIDYGKNGVLAEAQFSNYPFLLNNTIRSELFFKSGVRLPNLPTRLVVIITKAHMFPASNSTLYFEQARHQLEALVKHKVFDVPIRLVGLFEKRDVDVTAVWTEYSATRYSRKIGARRERVCKVRVGKSKKSRSKLEWSD